MENLFIKKIGKNLVRNLAMLNQIFSNFVFMMHIHIFKYKLSINKYKYKLNLFETKIFLLKKF